jgi:peptide subunit release factor RF-3
MTEPLTITVQMSAEFQGAFHLYEKTIEMFNQSREVEN